VSEDQSLRVKRRSPRSSSRERFSRKIESERPVAVIRTDSSHVTKVAGHVTSAHLPPPAPSSNTFVPISVAERFNYSDDELTTAFFDQRTAVQLLRAAAAGTAAGPTSVYSETVSVDAADVQTVAAVELRKLKRSTDDDDSLFLSHVVDNRRVG